MKRAIIIPCFVVLVAFLATVSAAQDKKDEGAIEIGKWVPSLESGVTLTQGTYSSNWAGGGNGSIIWTFITNAGLQRRFNAKVHGTGTLKLAYGQTHQQLHAAGGQRIWDSPEKSTDLIDAETVFRVTLGGFVDPFASARFESQLQDRSDPLGRGLSLNPLKFSESGGGARVLVSREDRSVLSRLGFTLHESSRRSFVNATVGTDRATKSDGTTDGGIEWVTDAKSAILQKRVTWTSKLTVYQPVFFSGKKALGDMTPA